MSEPRPLILTAEMDEASFDWFDALRRAHFPAERNFIPAHLTLFHALPGDREAEIGEVLTSVCAGRPAPTLRVTGVWSLGRGVAYRLASPELEAVRAELARAFAPWLTRQDQAGWRPHVTVQNKVDPKDARALLEDLQHAFEPFDVVAEGLLLWRYLGGPWEPLGRVPFGR